MPEGSKERGVGLSGSLECVANVEKLIFEKLNARRVTSLAPSPAEVCVSMSCLGGSSVVLVLWVALLHVCRRLLLDTCVSPGLIWPASVGARRGKCPQERNIRHAS